MDEALNGYINYTRYKQSSITTTTLQNKKGPIACSMTVGFLSDLPKLQTPIKAIPAMKTI